MNNTPYNWFYEWSKKIGEKIRNREDGEKLLKELIYDIRGEETPGRFFNKLTNKLMEYKTNKNIAIDTFLPDEIMMNTWYGDRFYYLKAAILAGLLNSMAFEEKVEENKK